ncbi:MAG: ClbS/DfsB family four-helix bundle protein [Firmicutes bacterium]|nr:ClbS/DfsB family four-helix bundle protein [Bacillota bacterium]
MPRATTKAELIKSANDNFDKMFNIIDSLSKEQQEQNFTYDVKALDDAFHWKRDKNLRDVLTHLYEWHQLVLNWVSSNEKGEGKSFLPPGITWANYQKMNTGFFEKHQNTPYNESKKMLRDSHNQVVALVQKYSDEELFKKCPFNLTAKSSIAEYCRAATVSHYDWAIKKLKAYQKALNEAIQTF